MATTTAACSNSAGGGNRWQEGGMQLGMQNCLLPGMQNFLAVQIGGNAFE